MQVKGFRHGNNFQFDIIAIDKVEVVFIEVKTSLHHQDINTCHESIWKVK